MCGEAGISLSWVDFSYSYTCLLCDIISPVFCFQVGVDLNPALWID